MSTKKSSPPRVAAARNKTKLGALANYSALVTMLFTVALVIPGYLLRGAMPDLITAAVAVFAVALALAGLMQSRAFRRFRLTLYCMAVMLSVYLILLISSGHLEEIKVLVQVFLAFCLFGVGLIAGERADRYRWIDHAVFWIGLGCFVAVLAVVTLVPPGNEDLPKNTIGGFSLYTSVMIIAARAALTRKPSTLLWLALPVAIGGLVSGNRLVLGLAPLTFVALFLTQKMRSRRLERGFVYGAGVISYLTVFIYINFQTLGGFDKYNALVLQLTGRQILSGRQLIWGPLIDAFSLHPWTGNGLDILAGTYTGLSYSTHNAFLMVLLQAGLLGFLPLTAVLLTLCWSATNGKYSPWKGYFTIVLACAIVHNTFECALIQNNFPIVMMTWLSLGYIGGRLPPFDKRRKRADPAAQQQLVAAAIT